VTRKSPGEGKAHLMTRKNIDDKGEEEQELLQELSMCGPGSS